MFEAIVTSASKLVAETTGFVGDVVHNSKVQVYEVRESSKFMYFCFKLYLSNVPLEDDALEDAPKLALRIDKSTLKCKLVSADYDPRRACRG